ncbi:uncharacterized protein RAG0_14715 [Rhynchosporium agropyri]|uniref:Oxidase ustYa n=1 Tax=Rhynchosporium agropyri TaxID=914238 RepID=A0A1E1LIC4_9HELO|nr:uncharacterized protein RAG0_14715 [Rhynchosporium agropyri]
MPPYNDIEKDLSEKDSFLNGSKHIVSESDSDNSSDTTIQNSQGLLSNRKCRGRSRENIRGRFMGVLKIFSHCTGWLIVLVIQIGMFLALYQRLPVKQTNFLNGDISHIVPEFSTELVRFKAEYDLYAPNYQSDENMKMVHANMASLVPKGSAMIPVDNWQDYPSLGEPMLDPWEGSRPLYKASFTHQLHCLTLLMESYDRLLRYGPDGTEKITPSGHDAPHTTHCWDYLRQSIMCCGDTSLEGRSPTSKNQTSGFGNVHVCKNYREVYAWIEATRVDDEQYV